MSPDERQMIVGLFDRMRGFGQPQKDMEADGLIAQQMRANPDASYMMVQSVLVQESVIQQQQQRVEELEARVQELEMQTQRAQPQQQSGGFLGGLFGAGNQRGSVPTAGRPQSGFMPQQGHPNGQHGMGQRQSPWGGQQGGMMAPQQQPAGGGFMRSAMATAAGVAGGMLVANAIGGMLGGSTGAAQAAPASAANDPAAGNEANDPGYGQDASHENDPGFDSGSDWGGEDL